MLSLQPHTAPHVFQKGSLKGKKGEPGAVEPVSMGWDQHGGHGAGPWGMHLHSHCGSNGLLFSLSTGPAV